MQDLCNPRPQVIAGFTEAIYDLAEVSFVNSEHLGHSVLTKTGGINPQLQIRIDVTLNCHGIRPNVLFALRAVSRDGTPCYASYEQSGGQNVKSCFANILLHFARQCLDVCARFCHFFPKQ